MSIRLVITSFVCLVIFVSNAHSQNTLKPEYNNFEVRIGGFLTSRNTGLRFLTQNGNGGRFNLEDDLGFDTSTFVGRIDARYRPSKRHQIDFGYFSLSRSASKMIDRTLEIADTTYDINTTLTAKADVNIFKASYTYLFIANNDLELGASLGLFLQKNSARIESDTINGVVSESVTLPLPVIGIKGKYDFSSKWHGVFSAETFFITVDKYSGELFDLKAAIEYDISNNFAAGLGYNWINIGVDVDNPATDWNFDWRVSGIQGYIKLNF